jgi:OOP family OmpA-OmpF porin
LARPTTDAPRTCRPTLRAAIRNPANRDGDGFPNGQDGDRDGDGVRGKRGDRDGDRVPNGKDKCPNKASTACVKDRPGNATPAGSKPGDRGGDGIRNGGAGDRDGDGVPHGKDKCPNKASTAAECVEVTPPPAATPAVP